MLADTKSIGERIAALREERGLKRQALSDELGKMFQYEKISRSAIEQLEKGITEPRASTILRLSQFFNVSADYLLTGASAENLAYYHELGLTDTALAFWYSHVGLAKNEGRFADFSATASALMSNSSFFNLIWGLITLNRELSVINSQIKKVLDDNPKPKDEEKECSHELLEDTPQVLQEDTPQVLQEDIPQEIQEDTPQEIQEDIPQEIQEDIPQEIQEDTPQEIQEDIPQEFQKDFQNEFLKKISQELLYEMQLSNLLEPLQERRDLLKLRYLRSMEKVFENLIVKGDSE